MKNLFFQEEHELFRSTLKDFFKKEVTPHLNEWEEKGKVDRSVLKKMGEMGFFALEVEEAYGGMGLDFLYSTILFEEIGRIGSIGFNISFFKRKIFSPKRKRRTDWFPFHVRTLCGF